VRAACGGDVAVLQPSANGVELREDVGGVKDAAAGLAGVEHIAWRGRGVAPEWLRVGLPRPYAVVVPEAVSALSGRCDYTPLGGLLLLAVAVEGGSELAGLL